MTWIREGWRRVHALISRATLERGLDEELRFHLERQTAKNLDAGMPPDEAHRQARIRFGSVDTTREQTRDEYRLMRLEDTWRDVRQGVRALRRAPGFTLAATLTVGLGIGATTAVFSVVYGVLLKPLPYPDAHRLISVSHTAFGLTSGDIGVAPTMWFTYREGTRTLQAFGLWAEDSANALGPAGPEEVRRVRVTHDALGALAVQPAIGRLFSPSDDRPGTPETIILMYGYWQRRFGGDTSVQGQTIVIDGRVHEIAGVMPRGFRVGRADHDVIVPLRLDRNALVLGSFSYQGVARLRPGVSLDAANADTARMIPQWLGGWPLPAGLDALTFENARVTPLLRPLKESIVGDVGTMLWLVMATILVVWLIACANVTNLLLVRAEGRQQELAVRSAMGAGWSRIAKSLLVESLLLGLFGGTLGVALAVAAIRVIVTLEPQGLPRLEELGISPVVLLFVLGASLLSGLLFSALPIVRHGRPQLEVVLRGSGRTMSHSRERHQTRNALVIVQVGLALVLLASAGLMIRTFQSLRDVQPGFSKPEQIQTIRISIPTAEVAEPEQVTRLQQALRDRMAAIAGVGAVSFATSAPLEEPGNWDPVFVENQAYATGQLPPLRNFKRVAPGYFDTVGTPMVAGRDLSWDDVYQRRAVVVISENMAREVWREPALALGRRLRESPDGVWREVVGVVGNVRDAGMHLPAPSTVHLPVLTEGLWGQGIEAVRAATFVVRSERAGTEAFLAALREAVDDVSGSVPIGQVRTVADFYSRSMAVTSFALVMLAIAAAMALVLGVIGIYGVMAYAVAQRTREIAIRLALGARPGSVRGLFVRDGLRLAGIGVACGVLAAIASTRLMSSLLFGVSALDPTTYLAGALIVISAAAAASFLPALRATRGPIAGRLRAE